jgi:hypothetical protein
MKFEDQPMHLVSTVDTISDENQTHTIILGQTPVGPVIEVREEHDGKIVTRRFSVSAACHFLLNVNEDEFWQIESGERKAGRGPQLPLTGIGVEDAGPA